MKKPAKKRQTRHRVAVSDAEVKKLIQKFRRSWRRRKKSPEKVREALKELVGKRNCSIRGLAAALGPKVKEGALRYYYNPEPEPAGEKSAARVEPAPVRPAPVRTVQTRPPAMKSGSTKQIQESQAAIRARLESTRPKPTTTSTQNKLASPEQKKPSEPVGQREEMIESLRERLDEVAVDFTRDKLWAAAISADQELFDWALMMSVIVRQGSVLKILPSQITLQRLYEITKPRTGKPGAESPSRSKYLGIWLAGILNSVCPHDQDRRERAVEEARQQMLFGKLPPPRAPKRFAPRKGESNKQVGDAKPATKPAIPTVDKDGRPLKPYEISLRMWAKNQPPKDPDAR